MTYTQEVEYAARNLITLAVREEARLEELRNRLAEVKARFGIHKWDFETSEFHDDFSDVYVQAAFVRMAEAHVEKEALETEIASIEASINAKQVAAEALCGALLQIVKQGLSIVHGSLDNAPDGRLLDGIPLKEIVWQARNQAIHYEEDSFRPPLIELFGQLERIYGDKFSLEQNEGQSLAKNVVFLLEWTNYPRLKNDMEQLGL